MGVDEHFEMAFPIGEILDFVDEQHPGHVSAAARFTKLLGNLVDRQARIERLVERDVTDVSRVVPAAVEQMLNQMVQQHRLADAARPHEDDGAAYVGLRHQLLEAFEVRTPLHARVVVANPGAVPPGILGPHAVAHLFFGDSAQCAKAISTVPADQLEKVDLSYICW